MKKTTSVHIKGINFLLEEDAFALLSKYLETLNKSLKNQEGAKEIEEDIELRIAELCSNLLSERKQVIELHDIENITATLGDPSQYVEDSAADTEEASTEKENTSYNNFDQGNYNTNNGRADRRLFRDMENAKVAGVCSGLSNYFLIDVVFVRILLVCLFLFAGFGLPIYIILWIVVPQTNSTIDRLRMRGAPINVETVKEEVENAAQRFASSANRASDRFRSHSQNLSNKFAGTTDNISGLLRRFFGIFLILLGIGFLIGFTAFVIGGFEFIPIDNINGFVSTKEMSELVFAKPNDQFLAWFGAIITGSAIVLQLFTGGFTNLFAIKNRWTKYIQVFFSLTYTIGLIMCIYIGLRTAKNFAIEGEIERNIGAVSSQILTIETEARKPKTGEYRIKNNTNFGLIGIDKNKIRHTGIKIKYRQSNDSLFHIYQNISAQGKNQNQAINRAKNVVNSVVLNGSRLRLDSEYFYPKADKLRMQRVEIIIEIPKNSKVLINKKYIELGRELNNTDAEFENQEGYLGIDEYEHEDE